LIAHPHDGPSHSKSSFAGSRLNTSNLGHSAFNNPRFGQNASLFGGTRVGGTFRPGVNRFGSFSRSFGEFGSRFGDRGFGFGGFRGRGFGFPGRGFGCWTCGWNFGLGFGWGWPGWGLGFGWPYWGISWGYPSWAWDLYWDPYWYDPFGTWVEAPYYSSYSTFDDSSNDNLSYPVYSNPAYPTPSFRNGVFASPFNTTPLPQKLVHPIAKPDGTSAPAATSSHAPAPARDYEQG
jgi:hypothetical protein